MSELQIYRKRLIPYECKLLSDDHILSRTDDLIVTSWDAFNPKPYLVRGYSCYYLNDNIKLSKMIHPDDSFHWYFDIAEYEFNEDLTVLTMTDLLADVAVLDSGIRVMDLDELTDAFEQNLITVSEFKKSLRVLDRLLSKLYEGGLDELTAPLCDLN